MRYPTLLFIFIATFTFTAAAPLGISVEETPNLLTQALHIQAVQKAGKLANERIDKMLAVLNDPEEPENSKKIETAFGRNAQVGPIYDTVIRMKYGNLPIKSYKPSDLKDAAAQSVPHQDDDGRTVMIDGRPAYKHIELGKVFYKESNDDQAGDFIHEAAHLVAGAEDDIIGRMSSPESLWKAVGEGNHDIQIRNPKAMKNDVKGWKGRGYAKIDYPEGSLMAAHADIIKDNGEALSQSRWGKIRDSIPNMHRNADSYRVFASLCARSLYKRSMSREDPVGYYLAKRQYCEIPQAAKAAKSSQVAKSINSKNTKGSKTTKVAKGSKAMKGTKASKSRKGTKGTKSTKATKGTKGTKAAKAAKGTKGTKAAKGTTGTKSTKAAKGTKGTKSAKGVAKANKGSKAAKAVKGANASKGVKENTRAKETKAAKGSKAGKGSSTTKGAKSTKSRKASKTPNAAKAAKAFKAAKSMKQNTTKAAKNSSRVSSQSAKGGVPKSAAKPKSQQGGSKAASKSATPAKTASSTVSNPTKSSPKAAPPPVTTAPKAATVPKKGGK